MIGNFIHIKPNMNQFFNLFITLCLAVFCSGCIHIETESAEDFKTWSVVPIPSCNINVFLDTNIWKLTTYNTDPCLFGENSNWGNENFTSSFNVVMQLKHEGFTDNETEFKQVISLLTKRYGESLEIKKLYETNSADSVPTFIGEYIMTNEDQLTMMTTAMYFGNQEVAMCTFKTLPEFKEKMDDFADTFLYNFKMETRK